MNILFLGDIVGKGGRRAVLALAAELRRELECDFIVANGENLAGGAGMTRKCIDAMEQARVDVITAGDHVWDQKEFVDQIPLLPRVLRPANVHPNQPGRGHAVFKASNGASVCVISLLGRTFMGSPAENPFTTADEILKQLPTDVTVVIVDFHAEATSEKVAMGRYLDGRVSAVFGTHTHVPTADEQIFAGGTAFQCDVGMVGARESILGRAISPVLQRFSTGMPARFTVVEHGVRLHATLITVNPDTGRALRIQRVVRDFD